MCVSVTLSEPSEAHHTCLNEGIKLSTLTIIYNRGRWVGYFNHSREGFCVVVSTTFVGSIYAFLTGLGLGIADDIFFLDGTGKSYHRLAAVRTVTCKWFTVST